MKSVKINDALSKTFYIIDYNKYINKLKIKVR